MQAAFDPEVVAPIAVSILVAPDFFQITCTAKALGKLPPRCTISSNCSSPWCAMQDWSALCRVLRCGLKKRRHPLRAKWQCTAAQRHSAKGLSLSLHRPWFMAPHSPSARSDVASLSTCSWLREGTRSLNSRLDPRFGSSSRQSCSR